MSPNSKNDSLLRMIFNKLKSLLAPYEPPLVAKSDHQSRYELEFDRDYETKSERTGKKTKKHGLYFAGIITQSNYVGLYFMPIYSHADQFKFLSPRLRKMLKGKTCFYVKEWDKDLESEIKKMVAEGYELYEKFEGPSA